MLFTNVPFEFSNKIKINSDEITGDFISPISTFELTLFKSINRGALISKYTEGINVFVSNHQMSRSILLEFKDLNDVMFQAAKIENLKEDFINISQNTSKYCKFESFTFEICGNLLFLRLSFSTNEAAGHNMTTKTANEIGIFLKNKLGCNFLSVSANYCVDKKNSTINGILGRGRKCHAEINIPKKICNKILKIEPEEIIKLNYYKNFIGSSLSGSVRSANAHFANIIAGFYLATGQDVANVVEASQGFTTAKLNEDGALNFSVYIPNIIIGSIGNGKNYNFIQENIKKMNLNLEKSISKQLAIILTATVLCGELSLLASLCNESELINSHIKYERRN